MKFLLPRIFAGIEWAREYINSKDEDLILNSIFSSEDILQTNSINSSKLLIKNFGYPSTKIIKESNISFSNIDFSLNKLRILVNKGFIKTENNFWIFSSFKLTINLLNEIIALDLTSSFASFIVTS